MKIKKGNHNEPTINNGIDNTITDGYCTTDQLYKNMQRAGQINIEAMKISNEEKMREEAIINAVEGTDLKVKEAFKAVGKQRDEHIEDIYNSKVQNEKIADIRKRITSLTNELKKAQQNQQTDLIAKLQKEVDELKAIKNSI